MQREADSIAFDRLWRAFERTAAAPPTDSSAWQSLPGAGELPPPWTTWTLLGLIRHRRRQLWVGEVVRKQLGGDLGRIAVAGAMGHPDGRSQQGVVPGLIEWEYYFHGCGCCLTHRVTGESIDVDFHGDDAEGFDPYFYRNYLESLRDPPPPERRLIDQPWGRAELLAVLDESDDQRATSECRAALAESRDPDTRAAVLAWEARHPHEPEPGPWITMDEVMLRHCPAWLRHEMDKLRDRIARVIARL